MMTLDELTLMLQEIRGKQEEAQGRIWNAESEIEFADKYLEEANLLISRILLCNDDFWGQKNGKES